MLQMYLRLHEHLWYRRTQHDDTAKSDSNMSAQSATKQKVVCAFRCAFLARAHNCRFCADTDLIYQLEEAEDRRVGKCKI